MSFLFKHHAPSHPEYQGPPQPPPPWIAEWDSQSQRWFFVNQQTGERSWNFPQASYGGGGYSQPGYGNDNSYQQPQSQSHTGRNTALAAAGGLAAGALLMHEGHKVEEHFEEDKDRFENRVDYDRERFDDRVDYDRDRFDDRVRYDENRVEDFPDDAARWTGEKVQEVEDIPDNVAGWTGRKVQEVEDIPGHIAGDVDRFEDRVEGDFGGIQDNYDDGRDEQRYDDEQRDDW